MQTGLRHVIKAMRGYQNQGVRREHERQYSRSVYRSRGRSSSSAYLTYWTIKLPRPQSHCYWSRHRIRRAGSNDQPWCRSRLVTTLVAGPVLLVQISCSGGACKVHHSIWGHLLKGNQPPSWSHLANLLANLARAYCVHTRNPRTWRYIWRHRRSSVFSFI